jgi:hypothetical protein
MAIVQRNIRVMDQPLLQTSEESGRKEMKEWVMKCNNVNVLQKDPSGLDRMPS